MKKNTLTVLILYLFISCTSVFAQSGHSDRSLKQYPFWIEMMDDTTSNFYEVQRAFTLYWTDRELPLEEDQILGMKGATEEEKEHKESWIKRLFGKKRSYDENEMAFALKKFRHWSILTEPWVQDDGRILYPSERKHILDTIKR